MVIFLFTLLFFVVACVHVYTAYLVYACCIGAPFVPTPAKKIDAMLAIADVGRGDILFDVGSGDGRIVFAAARRGAAAVGIEMNPFLYGWSRLRRACFRPRHLTTFVRRNFWTTDISSATVIMVYCIPGKMMELKKKLKEEGKPGTRVVSHMFRFPDWQCTKKDGTVHLYTL